MFRVRTSLPTRWRRIGRETLGLPSEDAVVARVDEAKNRRSGGQYPYIGGVVVFVEPMLIGSVRFNAIAESPQLNRGLL